MYGKDNYPPYARSLIKEYDLQFKDCGYRGTWTRLTDTKNSEKFKVEVHGGDFIEISSRNLKKEFRPSLEYENSKERLEKVGEYLVEELGGYENFLEALKNN